MDERIVKIGYGHYRIVDVEDELADYENHVYPDWIPEVSELPNTYKCHHCNRAFSNQLMLDVHYLYCPENEITIEKPKQIETKSKEQLLREKIIEQRREFRKQFKL